MNWVQNVLAPIMVITMVGMVSFGLKANDKLTTLEAQASEYGGRRAEVMKRVETIEEDQNTLISTQQNIRIEVTKITTNQEHIQRDIEKLTVTSDKILDVLGEILDAQEDDN